MPSPAGVPDQSEAGGRRNLMPSDFTLSSFLFDKIQEFVACTLVFEENAAER